MAQAARGNTETLDLVTGLKTKASAMYGNIYQDMMTHSAAAEQEFARRDYRTAFTSVSLGTAEELPAFVIGSWPRPGCSYGCQAAGALSDLDGESLVAAGQRAQRETGRHRRVAGPLRVRGRRRPPGCGGGGRCPCRVR